MTDTRNFDAPDRYSFPHGPKWDALRRRLVDLHGGSIFRLVLIHSERTVTAIGNVTSTLALEEILAVIAESLPGVEIVNELQVTAPFLPASHSEGRPFAWADVSEPSLDGGERVAGRVVEPAMAKPAPDGAPETAAEHGAADGLGSVEGPMTLERYPSIATVNEPRSGEPLEVEVSLSESPDGATGGRVDLADVPGDWTEIRVVVQILCAEVEFEEVTGEIILRRNGVVVPARFRGVPRESFGSANVRAVFFFEGRYSGSAQRSFALVEPARDPRREMPTPVTIFPGAEAPTLTVTIEANGEAMSTWNWMSTRIRVFNKSQQVPLGNPQSFLGPLLEEAPSLSPSMMKSRLRGKGEHLWMIAPSAFKEVYLEHRRQFGSDFPIQFVTDVASIPWEMMHPSGNGFDHLFMTHPVARWGFVAGGLHQRFAGGQIASFVPSYGEMTLPAAMEEGRWLQARFGAISLPPSYEEFMRLLRTPLSPMLMLHFAGHGSADRRGLEMEKQSWVNADDLNSEVSLGRRDHCLVVLNACEMAGQKIVFDAVSGWPDKLAELGFGGVLAPLWSVQDDVASRVVKDSLERFLASGDTLGQSVLAGRSAHRDESSAPYAYVVHGDVMARLASGASWPPERV